MSTGERPVVVLSRDLPPLFRDALDALFDIRVLGSAANAEVFVGARVYLATGIDPVPASLMEQMPGSVGLIANIGTGIDNIDIAAASAGHRGQ